MLATESNIQSHAGVLDIVKGLKELLKFWESFLGRILMTKIKHKEITFEENAF